MSTSDQTPANRTIRITPFNKAIVSGLSTVLNVFVAVMADDVVSMTEKQHVIVTLTTVGLGVYAVWRVPNAKDTATE